MPQEATFKKINKLYLILYNCFFLKISTAIVRVNWVFFSYYAFLETILYI